MDTRQKVSQMYDMGIIEQRFSETEKVLNRTEDIIALKKLQASVYEELGWFDETQDIIVEISKLNEQNRDGMCHCKIGTIIIDGCDYGTCGQCGKPTTDE